MKLEWYKNRIRSMTLRELFFYRVFQLLNSKLIFRIKLVFFKPYILNLNTDFIGPKYSIEKVRILFDLFPWKSQYSFFDTNVNLEKSINWRKDYKNNIISKLKYSGRINKQDFKINGDIKYIAELSRMHFLPFLAFKNAFDNSNFKSGLSILIKWEKENPFMKSINYTSGIEVAIRSVNLIYTHHILNSFDQLTNEVDKLIKKLVYQNYYFLKNHLSLYSSSNNHLIAELTGLAVISSYFVGRNIADKKWKQKLLEKILTKYNKDGMDDELSMRYHLVVSDHFINGLQFIKNSNYKTSLKILNQLNKVLDFTKHVNYYNVDSNFGDNDDSYLINPFFVNKFSYSSSIVDSLNIISNNTKTISKGDFRNYLIFGDDLMKIRKQKESFFKRNSSFFKESGYAFLYDNKKKVKLTFDIGNIGDKRLMAHGHSDQLSFTLQKGGYQIFVDPGTFQYHETKSKWRQYFRSIKAHNCISFNDMNHALSLGRMNWTEPSRVIRKGFSFSENKDKVFGEINAFKKKGLDYGRTIMLNKKKGKIIITDKFKYSGDHEGKATFYLHFHPDVTIEHNHNVIVVKLPSGETVKVKNSIFNAAKLIKGEENKPFGWFSDSYDKKQESFSLFTEFIVQKDVIITTEIIY